ncbi:MAG: peptide chain release factor 1 [Actinomycetota bacterium]
MLDRLRSLVVEYDNVAAQLSDPELIADQKRYADVSRRFKHLEEIVAATRRYETVLDDLATAKELHVEAAGDERDELREMISASEAEQAELEEELRVLLLPRDPNDGRNVILEIRGAEGGEEANLFARDLFEMYRTWAGARGWGFEVMAAQPSDMGGYQDVTALVKGADAWTHLKFEGGPHRVQRIPATESQGRIHTSSATVTVLPEADEVDVEIDPNDLDIDVYRSSGPGGQSVNTTDSAVRITHKPSGIVVSMQDEKSQLQNRQKALRVLRARLLQSEQDRQSAELSAARRDQIGGGGRSEKIRTYNFKENRVTDHRIGLTLYQLDKILGGELDAVADALLADERTRQLSS